MLLSMTGFGKSIVEACMKKITIEIKSLNSKQLDISSRLPGCYRELELEIRNVIAHHLQRGKVDIAISFDNLGAETPAVINKNALKSYKEQIEDISGELGIPQPENWYSVLLRLPDTIKNDVASSLSVEEKNAVTQCLREAIDSLISHRRAEGVRLEEFFQIRIDTISKHLLEVPRYEEERIQHVRARLQDGLSKIKGIEYDKGRLEQELIFYIEKLDINEEKQRLEQHLAYFIETMNGEPGQGKKLGFICQEIGREINTLGSKSNHAELQKIVVKMKDELEQIKEQVLNVM
ncbi:MAG: YicC family protein [Muribaculaceae bacterium]|nr:YicC family protein [Muribaculaceae bacterium]